MGHREAGPRKYTVAMSLSPVVSSVGWLAVLGALTAYAVAAAWPAASVRRWPTVVLGLGWLLHGVALTLALTSAQAGVRFGFAPALSITVWLVLAVHTIESRLVPLPGVRRVLALTGAGAVLLAAVFPGELRATTASTWLAVHGILAVGSYGLFGAAVLHALLLDASERNLRAKVAAPVSAGGTGMPLLRLERLTFSFVEAGFAVLSLSILIGWFTQMSWQWNHKTVLALLGWATFATLIAGRLRYGWRGRKATGWLYAGAGLLLLAYVGSRFVFEVLLHRAPTG